jgi:hypothetical protein
MNFVRRTGNASGPRIPRMVRRSKPRLIRRRIKDAAAVLSNKFPLDSVSCECGIRQLAKLLVRPARSSIAKPGSAGENENGAESNPPGGGKHVAAEPEILSETPAVDPRAPRRGDFASQSYP